MKRLENWAMVKKEWVCETYVAGLSVVGFVDDAIGAFSDLGFSLVSVD